jgi:hypothetical protein
MEHTINVEQMQHEIQWIKNKLKTVKKEKHRKDLERQIIERELGILFNGKK